MSDELEPYGSALAVLSLANSPDPEGEQMQPRPADGELGQEMGVSLNLPFAVGFSGVSGARGGTGDKYEIFRWDDLAVLQLKEMRKHDGQARALYRLITQPIRAALRNSSFQPADGDEGEAHFVDQMFNLPTNAGGMKTPFSKVMAQMLLAVFDGFSPFELVYWKPEQGPLKDYFTLEKIAYRPAETVTFLVDKHGDFAGLRQRAVVLGETIDVEIQRTEAIYYAANEEENPFYGLSYFNSAFYHYDAKVKLYYIAHLAAQVRAVGARVGKYPVGTGPKDRQLFYKALKDFGAATAMMVSEKYEIESWAPPGTFDIMPLIAHHNSQMSKSVLAQFFDESDGSKTALVDFSENNSGMFFLMLQTIMDEIEALINNEIIPKFIDWNFDTGCYPEFKFGPFTDEQQKAIHDAFNALCVVPASGVTPEFMRALEKKMNDEMGLEVDYDAVDKREKEEAAQNALAVQQQFGPQQGGDPNDPAQSQDTPPPTIPPGDPYAQPPAGSVAASILTAIEDEMRVELTWSKEDEDALALVDAEMALFGG